MEPLCFRDATECCGRPGRARARLLREAHLEQAVRLVQHQRLQVLQPDRLRVAQVVDQAPLRAWMHLNSGSAQRVICVARSARALAAHSWPSARHAPGAQVMAAGARAREPLPRGAAPAQAVHRRPSTTLCPRGLSAHQGLGTVHAHPPTHVKPFRACYVPRACAGQRAHRRAGRGWAGPGARRRGDHDLGLRAQRGRLHLQRQAAHHERHAHVRELRQLGRHAVHLRARRPVRRLPQRRLRLAAAPRADREPWSALRGRRTTALRACSGRSARERACCCAGVRQRERQAPSAQRTCKRCTAPRALT